MNDDYKIALCSLKWGMAMAECCREERQFVALGSFDADCMRANYHWQILKQAIFEVVEDTWLFRKLTIWMES